MDAPVAPEGLAVKSATIVQQNTDATFHVEGGVWLSHDTAIAAARKQYALQYENKKLREDETTIQPPVMALLISTITVVFAAGVAVGACGPDLHCLQHAPAK